MTNQPRAPRSETTLIVLTSVLLGIVIGGVGGYLVGRNSTAPVVLVASPAPAAPTQALSAMEPEFIPAVPAATAALGQLDPVVTAMPAEQAPAPATVDVAPTQALPVSTSQPQAVSWPTPTIPIPQARTATPPLSRVETITITDDRATSLASEQIRRSPAGVFMSSPTVQFFPGGMELHGDVSDPTNQIGSGPLVVRGNFQKEGANLRFRIDSAQVNGSPVPPNVADEIEGIVNQIFRDELADRKVESYEAQAGKLLVTVALRQ